MKLSDLMAKTRSVTLTYAGESVTLEVRVDVITGKLMAEMATIEKPVSDPSEVVGRLESISRFLCRLVASWDVLGDDEQPFPLEPERVSESIPVAFMIACLQVATSSVGESSASGVTSGETSGATSLRRVK
jgi:hypothetical protein